MHAINKELDPATVFPFGVDLQVLKCQVVETQQKHTFNKVIIRFLCNC